MKTAQELGITEQEYEALKVVRDALDEGIIKDADVEEKESFIFDMSICGARTSCGTAGCIGGWMYVVMNNDGKIPNTISGRGRLHGMENYVNIKRSEELQDLFFPPVHLQYEDISSSYAVIAIDNFLMTGYPDWEEIIEE